MMPQPNPSSIAIKGPFPDPAIQVESARKARSVTLIPGDGIGPEVVDAAVRAIGATGVRLEWDRVELNASAISEAGGRIPQRVVRSLRRSRVGLKGPVTTAVDHGFQGITLALRREFGLFANYRPIRSIPSGGPRYWDLHIDLALFRENTESLYSGLEYEVGEGVVDSIKIITRTSSLGIARRAFDFAGNRPRGKVTAIHRAETVEFGDGLFLKCCREIAAHYPALQYEEMTVDSAAMQMVMHPDQFDVIVSPDLYGDLLSGLAAGLVGGVGLIPVANLGEDHAIFEAVHDSAPEMAGMGMANPTALVRAGCLLLEYLGEFKAASRLHGALDAVYAGNRFLTPDVGGTSTTTTFTQAVIASLRNCN